MRLREKVARKEAIINDILGTVEELIIEATVDKKIKDVDKLFKCLVFLKMILLNLKKKLNRKPTGHLYS